MKYSFPYIIIVLAFLYCDKTVVADDCTSGDLFPESVIIIDWNGNATDGAGNPVDDVKRSKANYVLYPKNMKERISEWRCFEDLVKLGPFTVNSDGETVYFSKGNLQYCTQDLHECSDFSMQKGTWRFAEHQWDFVGNDVKGNVTKNGEKCDNTKIAEDYEGWIDLFGWATSGYRGSYGKPWSIWLDEISQYTEYTDGFGPNNKIDLINSYKQYDWGEYNQIEEVDFGIWRCLTETEWEYIFKGRARASELWGIGGVNNVVGCILLPDDWFDKSSISLDDVIVSGSNITIKDYTSEWSTYETLNAVFLPLAGFRNVEMPIKIEDLQFGGNYWSSSASTAASVTKAAYCCIEIYPKATSAQVSMKTAFRPMGLSVRLVTK